MSKKDQGHKEHAVDALLVRTFKDDLPPEMEIRMEAQLLRFQTDVTKEKQTAWFLGILPKAALAAGAVLMVVVGGFLQAKGSRTSLSDNISLVGTSLYVTDLIESSSSMLCSVELQRENGEVREYVLRRLSSGQTRIDVRTPGQQTLETIWIKATGITTANYEQGSLRKLEGLEELSDPFIPPLLSLLTPETLSGVLYGEWRLQDRRQKDDCVWKTYVITPSRQAVAKELTQAVSREGIETGPMEMTVDFCTYLPIHAQKTFAFPLVSTQGDKAGIRIDFQWNAPIQPRIMVPRL